MVINILASGVSKSCACENRDSKVCVLETIGPECNQSIITRTIFFKNDQGIQSRKTKENQWRWCSTVIQFKRQSRAFLTTFSSLQLTWHVMSSDIEFLQLIWILSSLSVVSDIGTEKRITSAFALFTCFWAIACICWNICLSSSLPACSGAPSDDDAVIPMWADRRVRG